MTKTSGTIFSVFGLAILLILGLFAMRRALQKTALNSPSNPYAYDLGELDDVKPNLVLYDEVSSIALPIEQLDAMAIGADNKIYVSGNRMLLILDRTGIELQRWDLPDNSTALAVDPSGNIYTASLNMIMIYDAQAKLLREISMEPLSYITSLAVTDDLLLVADAQRKAVVIFDKNGEQLRFIDGNRDEKQKNHFVVPSPFFDLTIAGPDSFWIINPGRHMLEKFSFTGELRSSWQRESMRLEDFCGCCNPIHITRLSNGSLITVEKGIVRIKEYDEDGNFNGIVARPQQFEKGVVVSDLAVDSDDRAYVLDPGSGTVRIFERKISINAE